MRKLSVLVGRQSDGYVFRLEPSSKRLLEQEGDPDGNVSSVFISYDTKHHFEEIHGRIWEHVITLLTGRSFDDLNHAGGFAVVDPVTEETLYDSVT